MRRSIAVLSILVLTITFGQVFEAQAQDRQTLTFSGRGPVVRSAKGQPMFYRVDDRGRPLVLWNQQVVYRALNNTNVYLYEGKATVRDEVASQAVLFHTQGQGVRPGHIHHNRDN